MSCWTRKSGRSRRRRAVDPPDCARPGGGVLRSPEYRARPEPRPQSPSGLAGTPGAQVPGSLVLPDEGHQQGREKQEVGEQRDDDCARDHQTRCPADLESPTSRRPGNPARGPSSSTMHDPRIGVLLVVGILVAQLVVVVRGNRVPRRHLRPALGPIPAQAGEPETSSFDKGMQSSWGLSPRRRGNPDLPEPMPSSHRPGPIPAQAGEPTRVRRDVRQRDGHGPIPAQAGEPPRPGVMTRLTARAYPRAGGGTSHSAHPGHRRPKRAYPRAGGGTWNLSRLPSSVSGVGLSPRRRGNHPARRRMSSDDWGLSPRRRGNRIPSPMGELHLWAYPRFRRGNRIGAQQGEESRGPIPAQAGEPGSFPFHSRGAPVEAYPRAGGGTSSKRITARRALTTTAYPRAGGGTRQRRPW